jgi:hypothetical protein
MGQFIGRTLMRILRVGGFGCLAFLLLRTAMMTNKTSLYAVLVTVFFAGILAKIRAAMAKHAPVGYQDETGFHLGCEPEDKYTY